MGPDHFLHLWICAYIFFSILPCSFGMRKPMKSVAPVSALMPVIQIKIVQHGTFKQRFPVTVQMQFLSI